MLTSTPEINLKKVCHKSLTHPWDQMRDGAGWTRFGTSRLDLTTGEENEDQISWRHRNGYGLLL